MDARELRAAFPVLERVAYLNAGTCGPLPAVAVAAAVEELEADAANGRAGHAHFERRMELGSRQRAAYAALIGCAPDDLALTTSTSEGMGIVVSGLELGRGDEIVTSELEHPGLTGPVNAAAQLRGAKIVEVPFSRVAEAVGPKTKLVACSHVHWMTGEVAPAELADVEVPVVMDGAQGAGAIPVDVAALGCDAYAAAGQKWLCGPEGTGLLYVSPAFRERIAQPRPSYMSYEDVTAGKLHANARRLDTPVISSDAMAAALAALDLLGAFGWDDAHARAAELAARFADELAQRGLTVVPRGPTTLVSWEVDEPETLRDRLATNDVVIRNLPGTSWVRAAIGAWSNEDDLERLLAGL